MKNYNEIIAEVDASIEKPFVTARFGDNWKVHTKRMIDEGQYDLNMLLDLAWKQGRRGILLERVIEKSLSNREEGRELQDFKSLFDKHYGEGMFDYGLHLSPTSAMNFFNSILSPSSTPLEQKELKDITDEDAIEVAKIFDLDHLQPSSTKIDLVKTILSDLNKNGNILKWINVYRYLSQKGYKL